MSAAYALGIRDRAGRLEFLRRDVFPGNLMRTDSPWYAWTWPTVKELKLWVDGLPDGAKEQLADRRLLIVPLRVTVGEATQAITLKTIAPPPRPEGAPAPAETPRRTLDTSRLLFGE